MFPLACLYFAVGLVRDGMAALYYLSISKRQDWWASGLAGALTLFDLVIIVAVVKSNRPLLAVAYAAGTAAGTFFALRIRRRR